MSNDGETEEHHSSSDRDRATSSVDDNSTGAERTRDTDAGRDGDVDDFSVLDRGFELFKLLLQRLFGSGVVVAFLLVMGCWLLAIGPILVTLQFLVPFGAGVAAEGLSPTIAGAALFGMPLGPVVAVALGLFLSMVY